MFRWVKGDNVSTLTELSPPINVAYALSDLTNVVSYTDELTLTGVTGEDGGAYTCISINEAGYDTTFVSLYISPEITLQPQDGLVELGSMHNLTCQADSYPAPLYQWQKYNQTLGQYEDLQSETYSVLTLEFQTEVDYGTYRCRITTPTINEVVYSDTATITGMSLFTL